MVCKNKSVAKPKRKIFISTRTSLQRLLGKLYQLTPQVLLFLPQMFCSRATETGARSRGISLTFASIRALRRRTNNSPVCARFNAKPQAVFMATVKTYVYTTKAMKAASF